MQARLPGGRHDPALRIPGAAPGQSVGLFGGSFNPPHAGHVHVSELVFARARLDRIWWLVTPGNPLKDHGELAPLGDRIAACREIARHPRIDITAFEARHFVRYTADTLALLKRRRPRLNFVWIMGADNLASFHRWQNWRDIADMMPIIVVDRPGSTFSMRSAPAAIALSRYRVDEDDAALLPRLSPPAWTFLHGPRSPLSSTAIRAARRRGGGSAVG
ncbi:MAG: nicotinate-nucleotide adenylyltransferase [Pseudomonadota bacterium]|nr:nicotinate-nucleotide adenylyltransferase [Pseudomonadota bacterium]